MQSIRPCLWFDGRVDEALAFYTSVFPDGEVLDVNRYPESAPPPGQPGDVLTATFRVAGQELTILNGGPGFPHSPAVSFMVNCDDQAEVDRVWEALLDGGQPSQCGWLSDRFGVSWQVIPAGLGELLGDPDPGRAQRAMQSMLAMVKLDIEEMRRAADDG